MVFMWINDSETLRALYDFLATLSLVMSKTAMSNTVATNHVWLLKIKLTKIFLKLII